jgi:hypothetical protein
LRPRPLSNLYAVHVHISAKFLLRHPCVRNGALEEFKLWLVRTIHLGQPFVPTAVPEAKAMDVLVLAIGFGFFALMFGYIKLCENL